MVWLSYSFGILLLVGFDPWTYSLGPNRMKNPIFQFLNFYVVCVEIKMSCHINCWLLVVWSHTTYMVVFDSECMSSCLMLSMMSMMMILYTIGMVKPHKLWWKSIYSSWFVHGMLINQTMYQYNCVGFDACWTVVHVMVICPLMPCGIIACLIMACQDLYAMVHRLSSYFSHLCVCVCIYVFFPDVY